MKLLNIIFFVSLALFWPVQTGHAQGTAGVMTRNDQTIFGVKTFSDNTQFGSGVLKSTFSSVPSDTVFALSLSSGITLADGCIEFADNSVQCAAAAGGAFVLKAGDTMTGQLDLTGASSNIVSQASVTASGLFGDGSGITNHTIVVSSSPANIQVLDIAGLDVSIATATIIARGGRPLWILASFSYDNNSANNEDLTLKILKDGVQQVIGGTDVENSDEGTSQLQFFEASSSAGSQGWSFSMACVNNCNGPDIDVASRITVFEY